MEDLTHYLVRYKDELNLSDISRKAGLSSQYLKHVVRGRRKLSPDAERRVRKVLEPITFLPEGGKDV